MSLDECRVEYRTAGQNSTQCGNSSSISTRRDHESERVGESTEREILIASISRMLERGTEQQLRLLYQFVLHLVK